MNESISLPLSVQTRIAPEALETLNRALAQLRPWTSRLPTASHFYLNERVTLARRESLPKDVKPFQVVVADVLFDVHSSLASECLLKSWRVAQLAEGLRRSLETWNLAVAAGIARALVETASAWAIESHDVRTQWESLKRTPVTSVEDATRLRSALFKAIAQTAWGTRLSAIVNNHPTVQRTNILTFVKKAQKRYAVSALYDDYEILCDAVHPSWGASECYWIEAGRASDLPQARVLIGLDAVGWLAAPLGSVRPGSPLAEKILSCSAWAIDRLVQDLGAFDRSCRDLCLTGRVFLLSDLDYWGIVRPTGTYDSCACGSGQKTKFCLHEFGERASSPAPHLRRSEEH